MDQKPKKILQSNADELADDYRFLNYSIDVYEDVSVKNRAIGFIWPEEKRIQVDK